MRHATLVCCSFRCAAALVLLVTGLAAQELVKSTTPESALQGTEVLRRMALSPDGGTALLHQGSAFRVVELASGRVLRSFGPLPGQVRALALAGAKGPAFVATEREIWTAPADREDSPRKLWDSDSAILDLSLSPDLDLLAVATAKGPKVLDPARGAVTWSPLPFTASAKPCAAARFAPVGGGLALALGRTVQVLAVPGFKVRQTWSFAFPVLVLAYAPDARTLAVGGGGGNLQVKRVADGELLHRLAGFEGRDVVHAAFGADSSGLFAAASRKLVAFSDLDEAAPDSRALATSGDPSCLAYSRTAGALYAAEGARAASRWTVLDPLRAGNRPRKDLPRVAILTPEPGVRSTADKVDFSVRVSCPADQTVTALRVLADGRPARIGAATGILEGPFRNGQTIAFQVQLPDRDGTVLVVAEGPRGSSEPATVMVQRPRKEVRVVPPVLTLLSPPQETQLQAGSLEVALRVGSAPDQPVQVVRLALDGVPVPLKDVLRNGGVPFDPSEGWVNGETYRLAIPVPDRDCTLMAVAETAYAASAPVTASLRWRSGTATTNGTAAPNGEEPAAKPAEEVPGAVKATADASRILEGGKPGAALPMEVDAKGRLRWKEPAADPAKKPSVRSAPAAGPPPIRTPAGAPSVQIQSPAAGARFKERNVQLAVRLSAPAGQEATRVQVFVDGNPVDAAVLTAAGAPLQPPFPSGALRLRVPVPFQDCQLSVLAENASGPGRPALLKLKFDGTAAPGLATRSVSQMAKPRIAIFEPQPNALVRASAVQVGVRVGLDPRQPPPAVRILVDAQEVKAQRVVPQRAAPAAAGGSEEIQYYSVPMPQKDCTIVAYAETSYATSDPALVKVRWDAPATASATGMPTLYLLSVGVSKYRDKNFTLTYPAKDARDFAETMKLQKGRLYKDVVARVRTDEGATRDNVMDDLEWIQRQATQRDVVVVFLAGHGINDIVTGNYYYLPWDASMEAVKRTMIPGSEIHSTLARLTGTRLLFMDTCHAGNVTGTATRGIPDLRQFLQDLKEGGQGLVVITSSRPGQKSQEHPSWNNGAFTKALVEGLRGRAPRDKQGFITFTALDGYITQRVKELTQGTQAPATQKSTEVSDFPVAFVEGPS